MKNTRVLNIYVCPKVGEPIQELDSVRVVYGGLVGDRYCTDDHGKSQGIYSGTRIPDQDRQISIISHSAIQLGNKTLKKQGLLPMSRKDLRRNIVVEIDHKTLNSLVGKKFNIGDAEFEGSEICDPCALPPKMIGRSIADQKAFIFAFGMRADPSEKRLGGLRARVIKPGMIYKGSQLTILEV